MGSFDVYCSISGFPVSPGDHVRIFFLCESPLKEIGPSLNWSLRTLPLKGTYEDYGRVKVEDSPLKELWARSFDLDIDTRGWGENPIHDVPTHKGMSFDEIAHAIGEERLSIRYGFDLRSGTKRIVPKGIPTLKRLTLLLESSGFKVGGDVDEAESLSLQRVRYGEYRVYSRSGRLEPALKILQTKYAAMISATYTKSHIANPKGVEIVVRPAGPSHLPRQKKVRHLRVRTAIVREDVWGQIRTLGGSPVEDLKKQFAEFQASEAQGESSKFVSRPHLRYDNLFYFPWHSHILQDVFPWVYSQRECLTEQDMSQLVESAISYHQVSDALFSLGLQWGPYRNGHQTAEWGPYLKANRLFKKIITDAKAAQEKL